MKKELLKRFRYSVRQEGQALLQDGGVRGVEVEHGHVSARVGPPPEFQVTHDEEDPGVLVELYFEEDLLGDEPRLVSRCECDAPESNGPCHHQWALVEHCEREGILTRLREEFVPSALWRSRLEQLERAGRGRKQDPWAEAAEVHGRLRYVFEVSLSQQEQTLFLTTEWQRRQRSGAWSQPRRLASDAPERGLLGGPADRHLADLLAPFDVPDSPEFTHQRRAGRSRVPDAALEPILRAACATGRLHAARGGRVSREPLRFDEGAPWRIVPRITRTGPRLALDYEGRRGEEQLELTSEMLMLGGRVLFTGRGFVLVDEAPAWSALESLLLGGPIEVPLRERPRLLQAAAALSGEVPPELEDAVELTHAELRPVLSVTSEVEEGLGHACSLRFAYGDTFVEPDDPGATVELKEGGLARRDRSGERRALAAFLEAGGELVATDERRGPRPALAPDRMQEATHRLALAGWTVDFSGARVRSDGRAHFEISSGIDWFDVAGSMDFGGEAVPLPDILAAARRGDRFITLSDGSFGLLPEEGSKSWALIRSLGKVEGDAVRFGKSQGWLLDALLFERESEVRFDAGFEDLRERLARVASSEAREEPESFEGELRTYQREGLGWITALRDLGLGGCLADDMGLGKTVQVLAELEERRRDAESSRPSIVVAPKSLIFNWGREAARFAPELRVVTYTGPERHDLLGAIPEADLVITTYGTLRRDVQRLSEVEFDYAVLDEAQTIKNASSQVSKAVRLLRANHRLALTGTPIENHIGELWSIFEFLNPGMLGRSTSFRRLFSARRNDQLSDEERLGIARAMRPFLLRRRKEDVLSDLPEKSEQTIFCDLLPEQRKDYDEIRDYYRASLLQGGQAVATLPRMHVLEALLRLRQAACHPGLLDPGRLEEPSAKFEVLVPMLEELREEGHKALVFSQFTQHLAALRRILDEKQIPHAYLDGRTRRREDQVDRFQSDPDCPLFLISLKAGGHGLNLTAADYVFLLDPWWNPAAEAQAIDRTHRIGQTRKVMAYRLIARDTAEEKVLELQGQKRELAEAILARDESVLREMTQEDLELLLS
jgi:superfamily II DNA or RNA helicase